MAITAFLLTVLLGSSPAAPCPRASTQVSRSVASPRTTFDRLRPPWRFVSRAGASEPAPPTVAECRVYPWLCASVDGEDVPLRAAGRARMPRWIRAFARCEGAPETWLDIDRIETPEPGSDAYEAPSDRALLYFRGTLRALLRRQASLARRAARAAGYRICRGRGASASTLLLRPRRGASGYPRVLLRLRGARRLILEVPHPFFDEGTLDQGRLLFEQLRARAVIVSGVHRCASTVPSGCTGASGVCTGELAAYPISDMAHTTRSFFHQAHDILTERFRGDLVLNLHGMGREGISLSDGTNFAPEPGSPLLLLAGALADEFYGEPVTTCSLVPDAPFEDHLCGSTDVQGRHINGSPDPCAEEAMGSDGRFIHLEQSVRVRAQPFRLAAALARIIPPPRQPRVRAPRLRPGASVAKRRRGAAGFLAPLPSRPP